MQNKTPLTARIFDLFLAYSMWTSCSFILGSAFYHGTEAFYGRPTALKISKQHIDYFEDQNSLHKIAYFGGYMSSVFYNYNNHIGGLDLNGPSSRD